MSSAEWRKKEMNKTPLILRKKIIHFQYFLIEHSMIHQCRLTSSALQKKRNEKHYQLTANGNFCSLRFLLSVLDFSCRENSQQPNRFAAFLSLLVSLFLDREIHFFFTTSTLLFCFVVCSLLLPSFLSSLFFSIFHTRNENNKKKNIIVNAKRSLFIRSAALFQLMCASKSTDSCNSISDMCVYCILFFSFFVRSIHFFLLRSLQIFRECMNLVCVIVCVCMNNAQQVYAIFK